MIESPGRLNMVVPAKIRAAGIGVRDDGRGRVYVEDIRRALVFQETA